MYEQNKLHKLCERSTQGVVVDVFMFETTSNYFVKPYFRLPVFNTE